MATVACPAANYRVNLLSDPGEMEALAPRWEQLSRDAGGEAWMSYAWRRAWWDHFGAGKRLRVYAVAAEREPQADASTRLAGVFALYAEQRRGVRRLAAIGHDSQRRRPLCAASSLRAVLRPVAERLAADRDWDVLELNAFERTAAEGIAEVFADFGLRVGRGPVRQQRYVRLDRAWNEVVADIRPSLASDIRRRERRLRESGLLSAPVLSEPDAIAARFDECLRVEASGWKGRVGTAMASDAATASFFRQVALRLAAAGQFRMNLLCVEGRVIAFQLCVLGNGALAGIKTGFDESWRRFAPGLILHMHALREAHREGIAEVDFLGEDEDFKSDWTPWTREIQSLRVYNRTARGFSLHLRRQARLRMSALGDQLAPRAARPWAAAGTRLFALAAAARRRRTLPAPATPTSR